MNKINQSINQMRLTFVEMFMQNYHDLDIVDLNNTSYSVFLCSCLSLKIACNKSDCSDKWKHSIAKLHLKKF